MIHHNHNKKLWKSVLSRMFLLTAIYQKKHCFDWVENEDSFEVSKKYKIHIIEKVSRTNTACIKCDKNDLK